MISKFIDSKNFDQNFDQILRKKKGEDLMKGRYDIESIDLELKSSFIIQFLHSFEPIKGITYKILFWEEDKQLSKLFNSNCIKKEYQIINLYRNGETPGILFIDEKEFDEHFLEIILNNHFNYEFAVEPSLNMRLQICVNKINHIILFDIYDDRGFDTYHFFNENSI